MSKRKRATRGQGKVEGVAGNWSYRWSHKGSRYFRSGYALRDDAQQALDRLKLEARNANLGVKVKAPILGNVIGDWWRYRESLDIRSVETDRNRWEKYLQPKLARLAADKVTETHLEGLRQDLVKKSDDGKGVSVATFQRALHMLSALYRWLGKHHGVTANPARQMLKDPAFKKQVTEKAPDPTKVPFIKRLEDSVCVFRALPAPMNMAFALSAFAGLRPGEAVALRWTDVNLDAGMINVARQVRSGKVGLPKSGKGRPIHMTPALASILRAWREHNPDETLVVPPLKKSEKGERFLSRRTIDAALQIALKSCKLPELTFYQAGRHSHASQLVQRGVSIYRVQKILGHKSITTTQRYAHLDERLSDAEVAAADFTAMLAAPAETNPAE